MGWSRCDTSLGMACYWIRRYTQCYAVADPDLMLPSQAIELARSNATAAEVMFPWPSPASIDSPPHMCLEAEETARLQIEENLAGWTPHKVLHTGSRLFEAVTRNFCGRLRMATNIASTRNSRRSGWEPQ